MTIHSKNSLLYQVKSWTIMQITYSCLELEYTKSVEHFPANQVTKDNITLNIIMRLILLNDIVTQLNKAITRSNII